MPLPLLNARAVDGRCLSHHVTGPRLRVVIFRFRGFKEETSGGYGVTKFPQVPKLETPGPVPRGYPVSNQGKFQKPAHREHFVLSQPEGSGLGEPRPFDPEPTPPTLPALALNMQICFLPAPS